MAVGAMQTETVKSEPADIFYRRLNGAVRNLEHVFLEQLDAASHLAATDRTRIRSNGCAVIAAARRRLEMLAAGFAVEDEAVQLLREIRDAMVGTDGAGGA